MKDLTETNDVGRLALMTNHELYRLYLEALGFPKRKYGGQLRSTYRKSALCRTLTIADALFYLLLPAVLESDALVLLCLIGTALCVVNLLVGPFGIGGYLISYCLDYVPSEEPSMEVLGVGSPESISLVADYLTGPQVTAAREFISDHDAEIRRVEKILRHAEEATDYLQKARKPEEEASVVDYLYDVELCSAEETIGSLRCKLATLRAEREGANRSLMEIATMLDDLYTLAGASCRLRVVREHVMQDSQAWDEEAAKRRLLTVCEHVQQSCDDMLNLEYMALARARANAEMAKFIVSVRS